MMLASNTIRWVSGPTGTFVTFPEDMGFPSIFDSKPSRYYLCWKLKLTHPTESFINDRSLTTGAHYINVWLVFGGTCSYPPPRENCAGPSCTNPYKYRDSKSKVPLCSLQCYKAIQEKLQAETTC